MTETEIKADAKGTKDTKIPPTNSMLKSVIWRVMGVFVYATIFYLWTRQWQLTLAGTLIHHSTFLVVFYLHERFWISLNKKDHWLKPFTYEIILGMGLGGLIVYALTGSFKAVTHITLTYTAVKLVMYYIYDKLWYKYFSKSKDI